MSSQHVVVAGAGPVGCVAAATLARNGIRVTLLEQAPTLPRELRASTFHPATLELLEPFGVVPAMIERGLVARHFAYRERTEGVVAAFDLDRLSDITRFPFRLQCEQFKLCEILLERFKDNPLVTVKFGASVSGAESYDDHAIVHVDGGESIRCDAVVAADGASSAIRKSLNLDFPGMTYEDRYLVVSTTVELQDHLDNLSYVNYISDPNEWLVLLRTVELWRALFPIAPNETDDEALSDASAQRRLQGVATRSNDYDVAHRTIYRVHQRVAEQFRVGRILLVGDAAHINNPLGGMGMNGGVHDAVLLSAGLAGWLDGTIATERLDHYASLRRDLAIDFVKRHTHANAVTLATPDANIRAQALAQMKARCDDEQQHRNYLLTASMITAVQSMKQELTEIGMYPPL